MLFVTRALQHTNNVILGSAIIITQYGQQRHHTFACVKDGPSSQD
jgi:hypothetical protein